MKEFILFSVCCVAASITTAGSSDDAAAELQRRQQELRAQVARLAESPDRKEAFELLDEMVRLDRQHPKLYKASIEFFRPKRHYEEAGPLMESFGPPGPGLLYGQGLVEVYLQRHRAGEPLLLDALEQFVEQGHLAGEAACHGALAYVKRMTGRMDEAEQHYRTSLELTTRLQDFSAQAENLNGLVQVAFSREQFDRALEVLDRRLEVCRHVNAQCEASNWISIGTIQARVGDYRQAIAAANKGLMLQAQGGLLVHQIVTLKRLGDYHLRINDPGSAIDALARALSLARELGEAQRIAELRSLLGQAYLVAGDVPRALAELRPAAETLDRAAGTSSSNRNAAAHALRSLGKAQISIGEYAAAERALRRAVDYAIDREKPRLEAEASLLLAEAQWARGNRSEAFVNATRALELYRKERSAPGQVQALNNMGTYAWRLGQVETARRHYESCLDLAREIDDPAGKALALGNLGVMAEVAGDAESGLELARQALEIRSGLGDAVATGFARTNLVRPLFALGRKQEALEQIELCLDVFRDAQHPEGESLALILRAYVERESGHPNAALASYEEAIARVEPFGLSRRQAAALIGRARVLGELGQTEQALASTLEALDLLERLRDRLVGADLALRTLSSWYGSYEDALDLDLRLRSDENGPRASAFLITERARARGVSDLLAESRGSMRAGLSQELVDREARLMDDVGVAAVRLAQAVADDAPAAQRALHEAESLVTAFRIRLRLESPQYALAAHPQPVTLDEVRQVLAVDETLLNYHIGRTNAYLWIVTDEGATFHDLGPSERIGDLAAAFLTQSGRTTLALGDRVAGAAEAEELGRLLLPTGIEAGRRLLVVADGPLHHVPFDALRIGERFVVEDHETLVVPSATALRIMRETPAPIDLDGFFAVGDPVSNDRRFPALPHSRNSLARISANFPEDARKLLIGEAATKAAIRGLELGNFRYLHFATHGWLDTDDARQSGLKLTADPPRDGDGFLYLDDIFGLRLQAQLVVLASCRSGLGEVLDGEGIVSLSRAFFYAGARSLIVTSWDVDDNTTAEFMDIFYGYLRSGLSISSALKSTKIAFINSERPAWRRIVNWAPFVLLGDPGPEKGIQ